MDGVASPFFNKLPVAEQMPGKALLSRARGSGTDALTTTDHLEPTQSNFDITNWDLKPRALSPRWRCKRDQISYLDTSADVPYLSKKGAAKRSPVFWFSNRSFTLAAQ